MKIVYEVLADKQSVASCVNICVLIVDGCWLSECDALSKQGGETKRSTSMMEEKAQTTEYKQTVIYCVDASDTIDRENAKIITTERLN
jgi:hypothetical protein